MKIFNIKGIIILAVLIGCVQLIGGLILSPVLSPMVIDAINKSSSAKISIEKVTVWPITLSCSLKDLKVYDPDNDKERIALVQKASVKISPLALLSRRLVISRLKISGAQIDIKGEPDGSFNVQKLAKTKQAAQKPAPGAGVFDRFRKKKDWFGRIYDMVKKGSSKEAAKEKAARRKKTQQLEKEVVWLPKGKKVLFIRPNDRYVFEIRDLSVTNSSLKLVDDAGESVDVDRASIHISDLRLDPVAGARFSELGVEGAVTKSGKRSGSFDIVYAQGLKKDTQASTFDISLKDLDLTAVRFIYKDSLPVNFQKGRVSVDSRTNIINGDLDSNNSITLKDHLVFSANNSQMVGFMPLTIVCDALNKINPVQLKFKITGTVEKPQFQGFEKILLDLIKPYMADVTKDLKQKGLDVLKSMLNKKSEPSPEPQPAQGDTAQKALESIKSLFGSKE